LFDNLSIEIRNGRLTYDEALEIIKITGIQEPVEDIEKLCKFLSIPTSEFYKIIETFRNTDIWKKENSKWVIEGFPVKNWNW
jgi:hypothetical protein